MNEPGWYWYRGHETGGEWEPVQIELRGELWCTTLDLPASKLHGESERTYPPERIREEYRDTAWCHHCDERFTSWAAAERHADATRHARIDLELPR